MSAELLPPDKKYPSEWHVRPTVCSCHPETCCCNSWSVHEPDGKRYLTMWSEGDALLFAAYKNQQSQKSWFKFKRGGHHEH